MRAMRATAGVSGAMVVEREAVGAMGAMGVMGVMG